jgi:outer membrane protein TolC
MTASHPRNPRRRARARGLPLLLGALAAAVGLPGCAGPGLATRHRAQGDAWERSAPAGDTAAEPFANAPFLERAALVEEVLRRNPSLQAARWAWRAALARYPQETSLDDPMLGYGVAPLSFDSRAVDDAHRFELSQAFPFPGKLALRGEAALAEAEAAAHEHDAARLRLATMASLLFDEWYLAARALSLAEQHVALLGELREIALARYESGEASQQDPLQADVEHAHLLHRAIELRTAQRVTGEQINVLLHRRPAAPLPPPPPRLELPAEESLDRAALLGRALAERPELRAADARVRSREAGVDLARREFLPDLKLVAMYDGLWQSEERDLRPFVGLEVNVPLRLARRRAALDEARARLEEARSEQAGVEDEVRFELESGADRLEEARHVLHLYRDRLLPAARDQLEAARAGFEAGRNGFLELIEAERNLRDVELGHEEALAGLSRRFAELERATGALPAGR